MDLDKTYMMRALQLAELGEGTTSPNPMVGCVIVHGGVIIGEGFHQVCGGPHAEVKAINSVKDPKLLKSSTLYVTLEPCAHHGKTPPCADLIIREKIPKVVVASKDIFTKVNGKGISRLKENGIHVTEGILEEEAIRLNHRFFTFHKKKRPYIILKWAQTIDGYIARQDYGSKWISNDYSRQLVHKWRSQEDAILVGTNTAHYDKPKLNTRDWKGRNPLRIVIDMDLKLDFEVVESDSMTIVFNIEKDSIKGNLTYVKVKRENAIPEMMSYLFDRGIQSVIIEGGSRTIQRFMDEDIWDEARVFTSLQKFGKGIQAPVISSNPVNVYHVSTDNLKFFYNGNY